MKLLVQKFGGTSVGSVQRIQEVAQKIASKKEQGADLVIVVSAMGHTTDELTNLAKSISRNPPQREMDMLLSTGEQVSIALLSIALNELGVQAISMTGSQVGILTESSHGKARILEIKTERLKSVLNEGKIVVVAGFQGTTSSSGGTAEITTLGRGGSDTSAVALAIALEAEGCEIYTDVEGVLTTDPRKVKDAQLMQSLSCNEMLELASLGAEVLHPRAVELARNYGMKLIVKSSWSNSKGTTLTSNNSRSNSKAGLELSRPIDGIELLEKQVVIGLSHIPDKPGVAATLFERLSKGGVNVDLIIQAIHEGKSNDITFTVGEEEIDNAKDLVKDLLGDLGGKIVVQNQMSKLSISGAGIMGRPGIAATFFETLCRAGINLRLIATSEVKVSCVIDSNFGTKGLRAVSQAFEINDDQIKINPATKGIGEKEVRGIALDANQAQVTVKMVPDKPGSAAAICSNLAEAGISLESIVQSERKHNNGSRDISFTLKKQDRDQAKKSLQNLLNQWEESYLVDGPPIAKVSAVGAGMPATPGTAGRMFRSIAESGINIGMIATSEIRISCVVAEEDGLEALNAVHKCFELEKKDKST